MATVTVGGNARTIAPFSAYKAVCAGRIVAQITEGGEGVLALMGEYARQHADRHALKVPRAVAYYRDPERAAKVSDEAWQACGNVLELPGEPPTFEEQLAAVFPKVFETAEQHVLRLLALILVTDRDLEQAYRDGGRDGVERLLDEQGADLLFQARMEELFALGQAAWDACREQLNTNPVAARAVGKLTGAIRGQQQPDPPAIATKKPAAKKKTSPGSSTGSPRRTGGTAGKSSSTSRSASSSASSVS